MNIGDTSSNAEYPYNIIDSVKVKVCENMLINRPTDQ